MSKTQNPFQEVLSHLHPQVAFEPIPEDNDALAQDIANDVHTHENDWVLKEYPDAEKLGAFWDDVLAELGPETSEDDPLLDESRSS